MDTNSGRPVDPGGFDLVVGREDYMSERKYKLYCYHINPIDWWDGAITRRQLIGTIIQNDFSHRGLPYKDMWKRIESVGKELDELSWAAERGFRKIGWEGDIRREEGGPYFFALPGDSCLLFGYILKQDNNGETFIASPMPLPWLLDNYSSGYDCVEIYTTEEEP
jgi:hypothetical protein